MGHLLMEISYINLATVGVQCREPVRLAGFGSSQRVNNLEHVRTAHWVYGNASTHLP